jgi:ABC-2 type transport system permease protein
MMLNPVLARELKERMRSRRAVIILVAFLSLLAIILMLTYQGGLMMMRDRFGPLSGNTASLGRLMFEWLLFFLVLFVAFIAPGIAAGSIVVERERRTLHPLQVTLLSPRSIVLGKLGASLSFVTLLVLATAPLFAVPLVLGGVTPWQVARGLVVVLSLEIALASMALYMSAVAKRIQFAVVAAYGLALLLMLGTVILLGGELLWRSQRDPTADHTNAALAVYLNPVVAIADAVTDAAAPDILPSPLSPLGNYTRDRQLGGGRFAVVDRGRAGAALVNRAGEVIEIRGDPEIVQREQFDRAVRNELPPIRMWMIHVAFLLAISLISLWRASVRMRTPAVKMMSARDRS